ncbi:MAG: peptidoglycan/LPS O-acetylase OafA/YrhL [Arenicella sp.]
MVRKWQYSLFFVLVLALVIRTYLYYKYGEVQVLSYWTLVGRIDQFLLGIMAYQFRNKIAHKHVLMVISTVAFVWFYSWFDNLGGYYQSPSYPSPSSIWIYLPTFEGLFYALLIAWYDNSINHSTGRISRFIALIGNYSYSIYLFHLFFVFEFAAIVDKYIVQSSSIYSTLLLAPVFYLALVPIGYLSFRFIEAPFLKFRTNYIITKVSA